jgi:CBS domain-containing protein
MTPRPATIPLGTMLTDAVAIMAQHKFSELPVVDKEGRPAGLIDITDVVGLLPKPPMESDPDVATASQSGGVSESLWGPWRVYREP